MADSTPSNRTPHVSESCSFQPTVSIYDWWLVKAENDFQGKRLAIAGVSSKKKEAVRVFVSAPIVKRHDVFSLETSDGIHIIINGFIDEQRTLENGFAPEVFNSFLFGFPPHWESYALCCFGEESKAGTDSDNAVTDNDEGMTSSDNVSTICPEILSDGEEKSTSTPLILPEEGPGNCEKPLPEDECDVSKELSESENCEKPLPEDDCDVSKEMSEAENCEKPLPEDQFDVSKEMSGVNVAYGSGGNRRSARLYNIQAFRQKKQPATGNPPKHPDKDRSSTSAALENCDGGLESPYTPIQSQSKGPLNTLSEQLIRKSSSRISRTSSAKTEGRYKKKKMRVKTETTTPKRKMSKPAWERDVNHLNKGSKQKISLVSPKSLNLKKSRSGRLLLPPLEFWRNQIPIYSADHEVTEIQEGKSLAPSRRGSPASVSRFSNQKNKRAA